MNIKILNRIADWIDNEPLEAIRFIGSELNLAGESEIIRRLKKAIKEKSYLYPSIKEEDPYEIEQIIAMIFENDSIEPKSTKKLIHWIQDSHPHYECPKLLQHLKTDDFFRILCNVQNTSNLFYYWLYSKQKKRPEHVMNLQNRIAKNEFPFLNKEKAGRLIKKDIPELITIDKDNSKILKSLSAIIANEFNLEIPVGINAEKKSQFQLITFPDYLKNNSSEINLQLAAGTTELPTDELEGLSIEKTLEKIESENFSLDSIIYYDNWQEKRYLINLFKPLNEKLKLIEMELENIKSTEPFLKTNLSQISKTPRLKISYLLNEEQWDELLIICLE
jgi:hypothetical protein